MKNELAKLFDELDFSPDEVRRLSASLSDGTDAHHEAARKLSIKLEYERKEMEWSAMVRRMSNYGIPVKYIRAMSRGSVNMETKAMRAVLSLLRPDTTEKKQLVIVGNWGCGKTFAAAYWLANAKEPNRWFRTERELGRRFIQAQQLESDFSRYDKSIDSLRSAKLLVIDDDSTMHEDSKGFTVLGYANLISWRYHADLPTIITTNDSMEKFLAKFDAAEKRDHVLSRMREGGQFIDVSGPDMRDRG